MNLDNILRDWAKIRYKKVLSRHWTGSRGRGKKDKVVSYFFNSFAFRPSFSAHAAALMTKLTFVLTTFWRYLRDARQHGIYLLKRYHFYCFHPVLKVWQFDMKLRRHSAFLRSVQTKLKRCTAYIKALEVVWKFRANSCLQLTRTFYKMGRKIDCLVVYDWFTLQKLLWRNKRKKNTPGGTRTHNLWIRSPTR